MKHYFEQRKILLAVTGSIAAYKSLELVSRLKQMGAEVQVVMTNAAKEFIQPLSFATLSQNAVLDNLFSDPLAHIRLAKWPDLILIAPATANTMAKYAQGFADDLLSSILLATQAKVVIAPAMNQSMWAHPAVQQNLQILKNRGVTFLGPESGLQACGDIGFGRMIEVEDIIDALPHYWQPKLLSNKTVLITAGPTQEALDPVRYLTNHSSGKMAYALAKSCYYQGAKVILISGPCQIKAPKFCELINVNTADEMLRHTQANINDANIMISCAAVCDFKPNEYQQQKIKKDCCDHTLTLTKNPDILKIISSMPQRPMMIGFAAETENVIEHAKTKLKAKNLDAIIANKVGNGEAFGQDEQEVIIINHKETKALGKNNKAILADQIIEYITNQA